MLSTIGAHPRDWTETIRGLKDEIQPISSISSNAFHIPIKPVPPPVGYRITSGKVPFHLFGEFVTHRLFAFDAIRFF